MEVIADDVRFLDTRNRNSNSNDNADTNNNNDFNGDPFTGGAEITPVKDWPFS